MSYHLRPYFDPISASVVRQYRTEGVRVVPLFRVGAHWHCRRLSASPRPEPTGCTDRRRDRASWASMLAGAVYASLRKWAIWLLAKGLFKSAIEVRTSMIHATADEGHRMGSQSCRLAILSFAVSVLAIGLECASAEECDYKTCGALMARDASASWAAPGRRDYSPDTKRACTELNACVRRAKGNSPARAAAARAGGASTLESNQKRSTTVLSSEPADKQAKDMQSTSKSAVHDTSGSGVPNANHSNGKTTPCLAVAEILVPVDCSPSGPQ